MSFFKRKIKFDDPILQESWDEVLQLRKEGKLDEKEEIDMKKYIEEHNDIKFSKEFDDKIHKMLDELKKENKLKKEQKNLKNKIKMLFKKK